MRAHTHAHTNTHRAGRLCLFARSTLKLQLFLRNKVFPVLETKTNAQRLYSSSRLIVLTLANLGTELLQLPAQSLIGSPGTLVPITVATWNCCVSILFVVYVSCIRLRLTKTSLTLINRTRLRTKGQSAGYPQAQIGITSNSFQHRAP